MSFECEEYCVGCYGRSWWFAAIGETVGSMFRSRKHSVNGVNDFTVMSCDDHELVSHQVSRSEDLGGEARKKRKGL